LTHSEGEDEEVWILKKKLDKEIAKVRAKGEDEEVCILNLLASDWEADQGRLVLEKADLRVANLQRAGLEGANLGGAELGYANLQGARLWDAKLQGARLEGANLREAWLWDTNLQGAWLKGANLQGAVLVDVNLQGASLQDANLQGARLGGANLQRAGLVRANLQGASLEGTDLQGAWLGGANLQGALYEPKLGALPDIVQLRSASHLETLWFIRSPHGLEELKQAFKKAGMRQQEQEITHAIKRSEQENAWKKGDFLESLFNLVFFDLPVGYGLYPGRALKILVSLIPLFAVFYGWVICRPSRNHGIYRLWPKERIEVTEDESGMANDVKIERLNPKDWRIVTHALYFSLFSTFNIGWRELNVGNWISRLQLYPYTLQAIGWVRTTSGIQALISVYLLALWALTYFGRPFE
jgi:pentapeptide repeat protein